MRPATPDDTPALMRMGRSFAARAGVPFDDESLAETFRILIDAESIFVAGDPPTGMVAAMVYRNYFLRSENVAQELFWWVDPESRGAGIGREMLDGLEAWAKANEARTLTMVSLDAVDGEAVGRLYTARGYSPLERHFSKVIENGD